MRDKKKKTKSMHKKVLKPSLQLEASPSILGSEISPGSGLCLAPAPRAKAVRAKNIVNFSIEGSKGK